MGIFSSFRKRHNGSASDSHDENSESDRDVEKKDGPPKSVHFFHKELTGVRWAVAWRWALTTAVLMAFIMAVLSLYWGSLFKVADKYTVFSVAVVDFDARAAPYNTSGISPIVGPAITALTNAQIASSASSGSYTLGWKILDPSYFDYDPIAVRQAVYDFRYFAAVIVNANATTELTNAVRNGNTAYEPIGACQLITNIARDDTSYTTFIAPVITQFMTLATSSVGSQWARTVLQNATTDATLRANIARVPQAVSPAIGFSMFDLRPFWPFQATPSVTVGLIYLIILSFFSFSFYLPIYMRLIKGEGHAPLHFWQMIVVRYIGIQGAYLFLSLAYSLVSLAFQINFDHPNPVQSETEVALVGMGLGNPVKYGAASFPLFWALNYVGMMALGLACENVAMVIGQPWTGLWLIFWVITNVSTSFYPIAPEPGFYKWGYAWPLHNVVEGTRTILFDVHSRLGLNFGILIAWAAVNTVLFPICCFFLRWKTQKGLKEYWA